MGNRLDPALWRMRESERPEFLIQKKDGERSKEEAFGLSPSTISHKHNNDLTNDLSSQFSS